jgi:hypothetical protein
LPRAVIVLVLTMPGPAGRIGLDREVVRITIDRGCVLFVGPSGAGT